MFYEAFTIPELSCTPILSIQRLPIPEYSTLDSTNLTGLYNFRSEDITFIWEYAVLNPDGVTTPSKESPECSVADIKDADNYTAIIWRPKDGWVIPVQNWRCTGSSGEDPEDTDMLLTPAPVTYATNRPTYLPTPVFNPNQSAASGGAVEGLPPTLGQVISVNYSKNEATVRLYGLDASGDLVLTDELVTAIIL